MDPTELNRIDELADVAVMKKVAAVDDDSTHAAVQLHVELETTKAVFIESMHRRSSGSADAKCLSDNRSLPDVRVAAQVSSNWQWFDDVEPDSDVDLNCGPSTSAVSVIKKCSKASPDRCDDSTKSNSFSRCNAEILDVVVIDDDDDDVVVETSQSRDCRSKSSDACVKVANADCSKDDASEDIATEINESVMDVWEGFDEGYAAGFYSAELNTSTYIGSLGTSVYSFMIFEYNYISMFVCNVI
jgi:hypothetical protein